MNGRAGTLDALPLYQRAACDPRSGRWGANHPDAAISLNNLASHPIQALGRTAGTRCR